MANNPEHRDLFPGALEVMILHSLRSKPMHGYALVKHIKQVSDDLLQVEEGSLYPALQRMLREGWLEAETGISAKGRPTRIYRLTDAGIRHLEKEVVSVEKMFAGITRVLAAGKSIGGLRCNGSLSFSPGVAVMRTSPSRSRSTSRSELRN